MEASRKGQIALIVSEGLVDTAYLDGVGVWTVGVGHTKAAGPPNPTSLRGKKLSIEAILELFQKDKIKYEDIVNRLVKVELSQQQFDALFHFVYNVGEGNFRKSRLLLWLNEGDYIAAGSRGFHGWMKPKSLRGRRDKERAMFLRGEYGPTRAPLYTANDEGHTIRRGFVNLAFHLPKNGS